MNSPFRFFPIVLCVFVFTLGPAKVCLAGDAPVVVEATDRDRLMTLTGRAAVVTGHVLSVGKDEKSRIVFVNFGPEIKQDFVAVIFPREREKYPEWTPAETYAGRRVEVRGTLEIFRDQPQIKVTAPDQIRIIED